jgi:hypothetical protein
VMARKGPVFADRYHAHILLSPRQAVHAIRYVLENWAVHAAREGRPAPRGVDPYCSRWWPDHVPKLVARPAWWMLCIVSRRRYAMRSRTPSGWRCAADGDVRPFKLNGADIDPACRPRNAAYLD